MKLAIADPPYLGRAVRWYGVDGRGISGGRGRADQHPGAGEWDRPARHVQLVADLVREFDGWAIAAAPASLPVYLGAAPADHRVLIWHRRNAPPSGARVRSNWEPVVIWIPPARRGRGGGLHSLNDVLDHPRPHPAHRTTGFAGEKPAAWTRWVLDALGYDPAVDQVTDLFPGSGAVAAELAQGVIL